MNLAHVGSEVKNYICNRGQRFYPIYGGYVFHNSIYSGDLRVVNKPWRISPLSPHEP